MENTLPCAHIPPLITADSTASPGIIERCSLYQRMGNSTKEAVGNSDYDNSIEEEVIATSENGLDNSNFDFYSLPQSQTDGITPASILDSHSRSQNNNNNNRISYYNNNSSFDDECSSAGRERKSDPQNFHAIGDFHSKNPVTEPSCNGASGNCEISLHDSLPSLASTDPNPGIAPKWQSCSPLQSVSASNNENCETVVNNLQAARPKETSSDLNPSYHYHLPRYHSQNHHSHHHHHHHHHSQQQINIPVHNNYSTSGNRRNTFSSVIQKDSSTSVKLHQPKLSKSLLSKSDTISSAQMADTSAATITTSTITTTSTIPTTMMPYSNCTLFKQGPLVQVNGPINGNMPCSSKCYTLQQTNGLIMTPDFKTITKMSQLQHVENQNQKKHSAVSDLVNYEGSLDMASASKSDLLIQSKLKNAKQQQHTCKSLKYENNSNMMNSASGAAGTVVSSCINCNNCTNTNTTTSSKLVGKKCKALYNLQCKFQKNRFISSLQDCCRACNSFEGCCGSGESFELETELLCPSYSYCDPDNVVHYNKDNNYKSQIGTCVEESSASVGCSNATLNSNNFRSNNLGSSGTGSIDNREEDFGDFIEADFPPVQTSRLMSSSTDSTDSSSSLTSSDINETNNQQIVASINDMAISSHEPSYSHFPNSNYFKNCDHKKHNQLSFPSPSISACNNSKCSENSYVGFTGFGDSNSVKREPGSSVIKCTDVLKVSSSLLSSSPSTQSSPSTSPSSATSPPTLLLCTSDNHLQSNCLKKPAKEVGCSENSHDSHSILDGGVKIPQCHNSFTAMQLPLSGATNSCQTSDDTVMSPEVDFLDFDIVSTTTPNLDSEQNLNSAGSSTSAMDMEFLDFDLASTTTPNLEQNLNSAGSSTGAMGFEFSLSEIPYADDVDSACPSPTGDLLQMNSNGSAPSKTQLTNCATNDLSASSSNSNLSALEDPTLPHSHSNFQNHHNMTQKCFSNLNLDDQDDVSVGSEESGSHDSNEIGEADDHCHLVSLCLSHNGHQNNFLSSPSSPTSEDSDFRDIPSSQEPIYEDIDRVRLDKCTADSPGDKCCCTSASDTDHKTDSHALNMQHTSKNHSMKSRRSSVERVMIWDENQAYHRQVKRSETEVSACGPIAVLNMLNAFNILLDKPKVLEKAPINLRDSTAPIPQYLFSRAKAGTTAEDLIKFVESLTNGTIKGRFFDFYPPRDVQVLKWLGEWIKKDAVPIATLNIQKAVQPGWAIPDSWHHQMIYGVSSKGAYMTNPLKLVSEKHLMQQLTSDRVLLIKRQDIISRFHEDTNLSNLMCHDEPHRWRTMNVLGQVVNVLREASMPRVPGYRPQLTQHIRIPAAYRAGITLFVRADMDVYQHLKHVPNLPLQINLSRELLPLGTEDSNGMDDPNSCSGSCSSSSGSCNQRTSKIDGCDGNDNCTDFNNESSDSATSTLALPSPPPPPVSSSAAAAAAASSFVSSPITHLHDYTTGRQRYLVHGFSHRNNVYVHYFKS
ncbi:Hypothetical predicted protein [Octopus vulgaris]|uniref:Uncharacterized protein n=1 Tax=Octopus vulgaris TaxID=6645 RepID=A0AA36AJ06_OCTVU|nr:Hypothetical predicted protein [Octopus vulgaris]